MPVQRSEIDIRRRLVDTDVLMRRAEDPVGSISPTNHTTFLEQNARVNDKGREGEHHARQACRMFYELGSQARVSLDHTGRSACTDKPSRAAEACRKPSQRLAKNWQGSRETAGRYASMACQPCPCCDRLGCCRHHRRCATHTCFRCMYSGDVADRCILHPDVRFLHDKPSER